MYPLSRFNSVRSVLFLAGLGWLMCASAASAQTITYTFSGTASGTYDGVGFTNKNFLFQFDANLADITEVSSSVHIAGINSYFGATNPLTAQELTVEDVGNFTLTGTAFYVFTNSTFSGYGLFSDHVGGSIGTYYDMQSDLPPTTLGSGTGTLNKSYSISGGTASTITLTTYSGMTFAASAAASPIPEPATYGLLVGSVMLVGVLVWKRSRRTRANA